MEGACRTADDGAGDFTYVDVSSHSECKIACDDDLSCVAYEYTFASSNNVCEIHTLEITQSNQGTGGAHCFIKQDNGNLIYFVNCDAFLYVLRSGSTSL